MFDEECRRRFPHGLVLDGRNLSPAEILYRSASGTFISDLTDAFGTLPDASNCSEALALGRNILDDCSERLEGYSRRVAKTPEMAGSLRAIALLPPAQRAVAIKTLPDNPLTWLHQRLLAQDIVPTAQVFDRVNSSQPVNITSAKVRELAETLAKFGLGFVPDPGFSFDTDHGSMLLFELGAPAEIVEAASPHYRSALLTVALGVLVGKADGGVQQAERLSLEGMVAAAEGVTENERRRLRADLRWLELHPVALASLRRKLAAIPIAERSKIADLLVGVASAGGSHQPTEVAILERIYRQLNLDPERLYSGLHKATTAELHDQPVRLPGDAQPTGYAIPQAPSAPQVGSFNPRVKAVPAAPKPVDRRAAIRAETEAAAAILADVFDVREPEEAASGNQVEVLEPRLAKLLQALLERESWPRAEFERLARELSLIPGAALENLNSWAFERYDDLLVEDSDPIIVNRDIVAGQFSEAAE
jgi:tellurite resistance protein